MLSKGKKPYTKICTGLIKCIRFLIKKQQPFLKNPLQNLLVPDKAVMPHLPVLSELI